MKSTSLHTLSADSPLPRPQRYLWFALNWVNNAWLPQVHHLEVRDFKPDLSTSRWSQIGTKSSPARALSDLFWSQVPWSAIQTELGSIHVFDSGCGAGGYLEKLQAYSGGRIASYAGVDIARRPQWDALAASDPSVRFHQADSAAIAELVPRDANLLISQSAVEHFVYDLVYFEQIRRFVHASSNAVIQIHLMPSSACLKLYLLHGVRQYTPRTLSYIAALFHERSYTRLYKLGGRACNRVHSEFITAPIREANTDRRDTQPERYRPRLRDAIVADSRGPTDDPSFYALVIHSNATRVIFD